MVSEQTPLPGLRSRFVIIGRIFEIDAMLIQEPDQRALALDQGLIFTTVPGNVRNRQQSVPAAAIVLDAPGSRWPGQVQPQQFTQLLIVYLPFDSVSRRQTAPCFFPKLIESAIPTPICATQSKRSCFRSGSRA